MTLNERQFPPFADVRVRRALAHAIDRELFVKTILDGLARRQRSDPAGVVGVRDRSHARTVRSGEARIAARRGGMEGRRRTASRQRTDVPLAFTLITQAGFAIRENVAQAIERQLRDVGVDVRWSSSTARRSARSGSRAASTRCCTGGRCRRDPEMTLVLRLPTARRRRDATSTISRTRL